MHDVEEAILETFKRTPTEHSTTTLVTRVFPDEAAEADRLLESSDKQHQRRGKQRKARLHRKLLYHLNKLVEDGILTITGTQGRGEKLFSIAAREGEMEIRSGRKRIIIHKPSAITTPIDALEDAGIALAYQRNEWLRKVNAVLLEGTKHDSFRAATDAIIQTLASVNDVVGLLRTDAILPSQVSEIEDALSVLEKATGMFHRRVVLIMSLPKLQDEARLVRFCRTFCQFKPKKVELVFNVTTKELRNRRNLLEQIIPFFVKHQVKMHLKNTTMHPAPVIYGDAGPYSFSVNEWKAYCQHRHACNGVAVTGASIAIDVTKTQQPLHELARRAAETLFLVSVERRRGSEQLSALRAMDISLAHIDDTIRFWNYDWREHDLFLEELSGVRGVVDDFSRVQERVYRACGMPIRFRISLSSAFLKFSPKLSSRQYRKLAVRNIGSFKEEELKVREQLCERLDADRIRFFRSGSAEAKDVYQEISHLINTYQLPFLTYDFSDLRGDLKLTTFFGGTR